MAVSRGNPLSLEVVGSVDSPSVAVQVQNLAQRIEDTDEAQSGWIHKMARLDRLRFGFRKPRNLPWKGASNISIPLIDGIIRRWRPAITGLILDAEPVASFSAQEANDLDPARETEPFFTWLFRVHMTTAREVVRLVDILASRGHAYVREGWDYETERKVRIVHVKDLFQDVQQFLQAAQAEAEEQGREFSPEVAIVTRLEGEYGLSRKIPEEQQVLLQAALGILEGREYVRLIFRRILKDKPMWRAWDPVNTIAPPDQNPETADHFTFIHRMSVDQIQKMVRDGLFEKGPAEELIAKIAKRADDTHNHGGSKPDSARDVILQTRDSLSGIEHSGRRTRLPEAIIHETFALLDANEDGEFEKVVIWRAPDQNIRLAMFEYPMPFDEWPLTAFAFSQDSDRLHDQRGIPEMVMAFQKLVNAFHNAWVDAATIQLAPMMKVKVTGGHTPEGIQWKPGGLMPFTQDPNEVGPVVHDLRILGELLRAENTNQAIAENYIGIFDASIRNVNTRNERRTATEVAAIQNVSDSIFGLDSKLFQESMSRSFNKVWKLWMEFGPPEVYFRVEGRPQPVRMRKSEVDLEFDIRASGTPANTQRAILLRNIEQILPIAIQDQSGRIDIGELYKQYFRLIQFPLAEKIIRSPEEATEVQQVLQGAAASRELFGGGGEGGSF